MRALRYAQRFSTRFLYFPTLSFPIALLERALRSENHKRGYSLLPLFARSSPLRFGTALSHSPSFLSLSLLPSIPLRLSVSLSRSVYFSRALFDNLLPFTSLFHSHIRKHHTAYKSICVTRNLQLFFITAAPTLLLSACGYLLCELASPTSLVFIPFIACIITR